MNKRHKLTDAQWERIKLCLPPEKPATGRTTLEHRVILNGMIFRAKTGIPGRDLPERYGKWGTGYSRWLRWRGAGILQRGWEALQQEAAKQGEVEWAMHFLDSPTVSAYQHAAGTKSTAASEA